jgi:glycosyltransferase involved in cell wall biosynthesis
VVLVPSHAEPLGNATLEAMAHGRPVVASRVGGIPEMVVDGETGLLVPPATPAALAAAIQRLLDDRPLRQHLGQAARARCETHFSLSAHVSAVVEQYERVLAEHGTGVGTGIAGLWRR